LTGDFTYEEARQYYELARETAVAANYPRLIWLSLRGLAQVAAAQSDWAQTVRRQEEDYLAQARQALSPAACRGAWLKGEQTAVESLL
jgi:hypothetical protein